jgi:hypothetical protein
MKDKSKEFITIFPGLKVPRPEPRKIDEAGRRKFIAQFKSERTGEQAFRAISLLESDIALLRLWLFMVCSEKSAKPALAKHLLAARDSLTAILDALEGKALRRRIRPRAPSRKPK